MSSLDKVEAAAKARFARDFGISTELALEFDDAEVATHNVGDLKTIMAEAKALGLASDTETWATY